MFAVILFHFSPNFLHRLAIANDDERHLFQRSRRLYQGKNPLALMHPSEIEQILSLGEIWREVGYVNEVMNRRYLRFRDSVFNHLFSQEMRDRDKMVEFVNRAEALRDVRFGDAQRGAGKRTSVAPLGQRAPKMFPSTRLTNLIV